MNRLCRRCHHPGVVFIIMTHLSGIASLLAAIGFMLAVFGQIPSTMFCSGAWRAVNGVAAPLRSVIS